MGTTQRSNNVKYYLALSLFKDITGVGYTALVSSMHPKSRSLNHKTFQHNCKKIRRSLYRWVRMNISSLSKKELLLRSKYRTSSNKLKKVDLWVDSVEYAKVKRGKYSKKDADWSYKLNNKGRKYLVFRSGDGKIVKIWGGYSPKLYDGHFIELFKDEIEKLTGGMDIIGD